MSLAIDSQNGQAAHHVLKMQQGGQQRRERLNLGSGLPSVLTAYCAEGCVEDRSSALEDAFVNFKMLQDYKSVLSYTS